MTLGQWRIVVLRVVLPSIIRWKTQKEAHEQIQRQMWRLLLCLNPQNVAHFSRDLQRDKNKLYRPSTRNRPTLLSAFKSWLRYCFILHIAFWTLFIIIPWQPMAGL